MLFYLTDMFLDVVYGASFWILKKTSSGMYHIIWGRHLNNRIEDREYETIIISKEDIIYQDTLNELIEKTNNQEKQIKDLNENIKELTTIIKINQNIQ